LAALGRLIGELLLLAGNTNVTPGGYAVVGAAAFTAGVTHTVSIALIVFELTNQLSYMLPVLLAVLVSRMVSGRSTLHPGGIFSLIGKQLNLYN
jgi:chloride channel 2